MRRERGADAPARIVVADRDQTRLDEIRRIHAGFPSDVPVDYVLAAATGRHRFTPEDCGMTVLRVPPSADTAALRENFDPDLFITDPDITASYARDRTGAYVGLPFALARPRSAIELAAIVVRFGDLGLGVVPQGGLTGLLGAAASGALEPEVVVILDSPSGRRAPPGSAATCRPTRAASTCCATA